MKIFIVCSKHFYNRVNEIKQDLENLGHKIMLPNSFDDPFKEEKMKGIDEEHHINFKQKMMRLHESKIKENDAILVLNFEKKENKNYIGGATFMEIVKAWELGKRIFLFNPIPDNILKDEIEAFNPIIINGNLSLIN